MPLLETALDECMQDKQFFIKGVDKMIVNLFENVTLMSDQAASMIKFILIFAMWFCYKIQNSIRFFLKHLPEEMSNAERGWYSSLFRMLESRYPAVLDSETSKMFAKDAGLKDSYHCEYTEISYSIFNALSGVFFYSSFNLRLWNYFSRIVLFF
jgi:hypothetical protein